MRLLSMGAGDLREEILAQVEKNPALELVSDGFQNGLQSARFKNPANGNLRLSASGSLGQEKSDAFQEMLESRADNRESLFSHLSAQLNLLDLDQAKKNLCQKIIGNLDSRGFYILAPSSLLDKKAGESPKLLAECLKIVQSFEPAGICVENVEKSLLLQAQLKDNPPPLALFFLDGRLDFLDPPRGERVREKIQAFLKERGKLLFANDDFSFLREASLEKIEEAIGFVKSLDPFPARDFLQEETHYVIPDIIVERIQGAESDFDKEEADWKNQIVRVGGGLAFLVQSSDKMIPKVKISSQEFDKKDLEAAKAFLQSLEYRENSIAKAARAIVQCQAEFFEKGPGHLKALRQKDIAKKIGVHESTVSRMASSKYLKCQWGFFQVKDFFSSSVAGTSKDKVQSLVQEILAGPFGKKMSDQKICDALLQKGIKLSRRTLAKYRAQMGVASSRSR